MILAMNKYYTAANAQSAGLDFYQNSGKFATGGGGIKDPNGARGNFGFNARYSKSGKPQGQMVYIYRGMYNGVTADFIIKSNALSDGTAIRWNEPIRSAPRCRANAPSRSMMPTLVQAFSAMARPPSRPLSIDTNKSSGIGFDSFSLTVWNKNGVVYKLVPTTLLSSGNVVIHLK